VAELAPYLTLRKLFGASVAFPYSISYLASYLRALSDVERLLALAQDGHGSYLREGVDIRLVFIISENLFRL
jgi:hypothetical protein